ncbi:MAG: type II toxin-antitoxin system VapC family toxin [Herpetosiphon sp.]|nr:type II toxin-antitoxin system VapC family toxin [Herpetosiphon sp.]
MNILVDTHIFLWWHSMPEKLPLHFRQHYEDQQTTIYLSVASIWEIQIKLQIGKLRLNQSLETILNLQQTANQLQILPIALRHVLNLARVPLIHKNPFDRLLIAQALADNLTIMTKDHVFAQYPIQTIPIQP